MAEKHYVLAYLYLINMNQNIGNWFGIWYVLAVPYRDTEPFYSII